MKTVKTSTTDPDSGYMFREGKPEGFFYLDHRTVDIKYNIITDVHVTPGNVSDQDPYIERLDRQMETFKFDVKYVGLDAGYFTNPICKQINERDIQAVMGFRRSQHEKGKYSKYSFQYVRELDVYVCPDLRPLKYKTTTRDGYKEYVASKDDCCNCTHKEKCLTGKNIRKEIRRHVWEDHKEKVYRFTRSEKGRRLYKRRKETVERSFADSKELHGLRYCRLRGKDGVSEQCLLTAAAQNIKKIAMVLHRRLSFCNHQDFCHKYEFICQIVA